MISNQNCRVKHAPVSWLGTRPLLKLKVSFLKSLEVWILLTEVSAPSTIRPPHTPEVPACIGTERKYHSSARLESVDGDGETNWQKGRLTGGKATDFIWDLFILFDSKYFIERSNHPKDTDEPGVLYCRKAAGKKLRKTVGFSRRDVVQIHQDASCPPTTTGALLFLTQPAPLRVEICALLLELKKKKERKKTRRDRALPAAALPRHLELRIIHNPYRKSLVEGCVLFLPRSSSPNSHIYTNPLSFSYLDIIPLGSRSLGLLQYLRGAWYLVCTPLPWIVVRLMI